MQTLHKDNRYLKTNSTCNNMGLLKDFVQGMSENKKVAKAKLKDAEQDMRIQKILEERNKSANERDLEKRLEKKRQEKIKIALDKLRKEDTKELWKSSNSMIKGQKSILKNDRPILKEKNIFKDNKNIFTNQGGMFK